MKHLIIAFKSRNELYGFARILKSNNVFLSIINSPKTIASSCTLSIKADFRFLNTINQLLLRYQPRSFLGLFVVQSTSNGEQTLRLL
ncbi:MAG: DUF3343 domain-containing protein [Clostridia bacterium]|nr:DUF3343 domain-containing protein [Clostridia bacterium]